MEYVKIKPFETEKAAEKAGNGALIKKPFHTLPTKYGKWLFVTIGPDGFTIKGNSGKYQGTNPDDEFCQKFFSDETIDKLRGLCNV